MFCGGVAGGSSSGMGGMGGDEAVDVVDAFDVDVDVFGPGSGCGWTRSG